jgi:hypothetical protein
MLITMRSPDPKIFFHFGLLGLASALHPSAERRQSPRPPLGSPAPIYHPLASPSSRARHTFPTPGVTRFHRSVPQLRSRLPQRPLPSPSMSRNHRSPITTTERTVWAAARISDSVDTISLLCWHGANPIRPRVDSVLRDLGGDVLFLVACFPEIALVVPWSQVTNQFLSRGGDVLLFDHLFSNRIHHQFQRLLL